MASLFGFQAQANGLPQFGDTYFSSLNGEYHGTKFRVRNIATNSDHLNAILDSLSPDEIEKTIVSFPEGRIDESILKKFKNWLFKDGEALNSEVDLKSIELLPIPLRVSNEIEKASEKKRQGLKAIPSNNVDLFFSSVFVGQAVFNWFYLAPVGFTASVAAFSLSLATIYFFDFKKWGFYLQEGTVRATQSAMKKVFGKSSKIQKIANSNLFDLLMRQSQDFVMSLGLTFSFRMIAEWGNWANALVSSHFWIEVATLSVLSTISGGLWSSWLSRMSYSPKKLMSQISISMTKNFLKVLRAALYPISMFGPPLLPLVLSPKTVAFSALGVMAVGGLVAALRGEEILEKFSRPKERFGEPGSKGLAQKMNLLLKPDKISPAMRCRQATRF